MSRLNLTWDNITPHPVCGYRADYRRTGEQVAYSELLTSGSTSGTTVVYIPIDAPANYEGLIYTDCCSGSTSAGDPFAVNAYQLLSLLVSISGTTMTAVLSSAYSNSYDVMVNIVANYHTGITPHVFNVTPIYTAGSISTKAMTTVDAGSVIDSYSITSIAPVFNNGGQLQQFDPISTPSYFAFYKDSIPDASGSPIAQPSFILDAFNITERDISDNPTAGNLLVFWGQPSVYLGGTTPYDNFTFEVKDSSGSTLGTVTIEALTNGLRNLTIPIQKANVALTTTNLLAMYVYWDDGSTIDTATFYLPDFS